MSNYEDKYKYWKKKELTNAKSERSISEILEEEGKINEEFKYMLSKLKLENIIALKMELTAKSLKGKLFGIPFWKKSPDIIKDALVKFALSITDSRQEAAEFLGIRRRGLQNYLQKQEIDDLFEKY